MLPKLGFKSTLPTSNDIRSEHWIGFLSSLEFKLKWTTARWYEILVLFGLIKSGAVHSG